MLELNAISHAKIETKPFKFAVINNLITKENVDVLINNLPKDNNYVASRTEGSDKTYQVVSNILLPLGEGPGQITTNNDHWLKLIHNLMSKEYKIHLGQLLGIDLLNCFQEITLRFYRPGDYISPHTDREVVKATHMIFLNQFWQENWGGLFCVMLSENETYLKILPLWHNSVVFLRSDNSWHCVTPCAATAVPRIALQVAFKEESFAFSPEGMQRDITKIE